MSKFDWAEDFSHENGKYQCECHLCHVPFIGHKRRVLCKACFYNYPDEPFQACEGYDEINDIVEKWNADCRSLSEEENKSLDEFFWSQFTDKVPVENKIPEDTLSSALQIIEEYKEALEWLAEEQNYIEKCNGTYIIRGVVMNSKRYYGKGKTPLEAIKSSKLPKNWGIET